MAGARAGRDGHSPGSPVWVTAGSAVPSQGRAARDHGVAQQQIVLAQVPAEPEKGERKPYFMCKAFLPSL